MNDQNFRNFVFNSFFVKFWKCVKKYFEIRNFFCFCLILYKEKMLTDKATVKSWSRSLKSLVIYTLLGCRVFVRLFVSSKRQNGWTDRAQFFCRTSCDHREGLWMIEFLKISSNKIRSLKILKIHEIFFCYKIREIICLLLFYNVYKEKMFTICN